MHRVWLIEDKIYPISRTFCNTVYFSSMFRQHGGAVLTSLYSIHHGYTLDVLVVIQMIINDFVLQEDGKSSGSCLWFRVPVCGLWVPVFCNASPFFVMCHFFHSVPTSAPNILRNAPVHYTKKWRITNNWYLKPETRTSVINSLVLQLMYRPIYHNPIVTLRPPPPRRITCLAF